MGARSGLLFGQLTLANPEQRAFIYASCAAWCKPSKQQETGGGDTMSGAGHSRTRSTATLASRASSSEWDTQYRQAASQSGRRGADGYGEQDVAEQDVEDEDEDDDEIVLKVGMVGDAQIGKTSLMVKYIEGCFDDDYIQTLGVNFMEKTVAIRGQNVKFTVWDLGGQREFTNMLPLVARGAIAIFYMFDLSRKTTLNSIKDWYPQAKGMNKEAIPFLIGTKYDIFAQFPEQEKALITNQVYGTC